MKTFKEFLAESLKVKDFEALEDKISALAPTGWKISASPNGRNSKGREFIVDVPGKPKHDVALTLSVGKFVLVTVENWNEKASASSGAYQKHKINFASESEKDILDSVKKAIAKIPEMVK